MTASERDSLDTAGYVVLKNLLDSETLEQIRNRVEELYELEGENAGSEFRKEPGARRLANLIDKGSFSNWSLPLVCSNWFLTYWVAGSN
jgi:ectoine hydroxylase-related dioxygenase (phytanoyl-CoA dioxygenase family)